MENAARSSTLASLRAAQFRRVWGCGRTELSRCVMLASQLTAASSWMIQHHAFSLLETEGPIAQSFTDILLHKHGLSYHWQHGITAEGVLCSPSTGMSALMHSNFVKPLCPCMRQVTLSISSACEHCDGFPRSRQVLKEYLLAVRRRHFLDWLVFISGQSSWKSPNNSVQVAPKSDEGQQSSQPHLQIVWPLCFSCLCSASSGRRRVVALIGWPTH